MFTDMVGYTALMQTDETRALDKRERYVTALDAQHAAFDGTIVQRLGDGSMSMFPSSFGAVQAAVAMQRDLAAQDVQVRIGVHVGEVIVEPERLTGEAVNIAARIESFATPGGVLLSDSAYDQIKNRRDLDVVPLGRFRLKNVGRAFELYAVEAEGVVVPDAATLEGKGERFASLPNNLPQPAADVVGREVDVAALVDLVRAHRLVTITGPGGVGKTRILVELGTVLASEFLDGVSFVPLAAITDPGDLLPAVAEALDVKEAEERTLAEGLVALIGGRRVLLLLDNLEQVLGAATDVAGLIERCPELRIVTTSRTPLRIAAEREYPLEPLELSASVALFSERASSVKGSFAVTPENAAAVESICCRLDGLPLALELAAARLRLLTPAALLERLDHALDVLRSSARDAPERQQTLRATIDWSHSLLTETEQRLFRRLAVFAEGCTLGDVEAVCAEPGDQILDELESLLDKALVKVDGERLRMLATILEFARERLDAAGEADEIASRHARRYAALAREIRDGIEGTAQIGSLERGIVEEGNLQAALDSLLTAARAGDAAATELGLEMSGDLYMYWHIRGKNVTAREYAQAFLDADAGAKPSAGLAGALITAGLASWVLGQFERANDEWDEAYRVAEAIDADRELCVAAWAHGLGLLGFDLEAALARTGKSIEKSRAIGFAWAEGFASTVEGLLHAVAGDLDAAQARYARALEIQQRLGDQEGAGLTLGFLAQLTAGRGDLVAALDLYRESLAAFEAVGDRAEEARILSETAWTHLQTDDSSLARRFFFASVRAYTDVASVRGVGLSLIGLAATEAAEQRPETAVQIAAAAEIYAQQEGIVNVYADETPGRALVEQARSSLSPDDAARAEELGRRLSIGDVLAAVESVARAPA